MKFSVFTPTHDIKDIDQPLQSLKNQTLKDFEWVILLNKGALDSEAELKTKLSGSEIKFKIIRQEEQPPASPEDKKEEAVEKNIGFLKKKCCSEAEGEYLVELDHDDALMPECLEQLSKAFNEGYDFVYSDDYFLTERKNESGAMPEAREWDYVTPFSSDFGWKVEIDEEGNRYHPSHDPSALSLSYIWYAPDHVRAWKKSFYDKIGGHEEKLDVCDDYELLCRTYIKGSCHRIPKPLYKYHAFEKRTSANEKNKKIQELTMQIHDVYILEVASKWADINNLKKIDLGSGSSTYSDFTGVDKKENGSNVVFDLNEPNWPFEDGSVGVFRSWNSLNFLEDPIHVMKEAYRCLSDYGWFIIDVPSTDGRGAFMDPLKASYWNSNSFWYYTKKDWSRLIDTPVKFQLNRIDNYHPSQFEEYHKILFTKAHLVKLPEKGFAVPINGREI